MEGKTLLGQSGFERCLVLNVETQLKQCYAQLWADANEPSKRAVFRGRQIARGIFMGHIQRSLELLLTRDR